MQAQTPSLRRSCALTMLWRAAVLLHLCTAADPYERGLAAARKRTSPEAGFI